tara:strand:- start:134 stop:289 length:156 start_codon:yes stop_codon:yes gene_type:complete
MGKGAPMLASARTMTTPNIVGCYLKTNVARPNVSIGREKIVTFSIDTNQKI